MQHEVIFYEIMKELDETQEEKFLLQGFLDYILNVCNLIKIRKPMNLKGMYSLFSLMEILEKLSNRSYDQYKLILYNSNRVCGGGIQKGVSGVNFELIYDNATCKEQKIWGWIGVYYNREDPIICMGFYNNAAWGANYIKLIDIFRSKWGNKKEFKKPYYESGESYLWFEMSDEFSKAFDASNDINDQEVILQGFMDAVINYPFELKAMND